MNKKDSFLASFLGLATVVSATVTYKMTILQGKVGHIDFNGFAKNICGDEAPSFLWVFDLSSAPGLLFYAYMPMAAIATLFALLLLQRKHRSQPSLLLAALLGTFVLWILCILAEWLSSYHTVLMYSWQLIAMIEIGVYLLAFYFAYAYVHEKDLPDWAKYLLSAIYLAVLALTPTLLNIPSYSPSICAGTTDSPLWHALYFVVEPLLIVAIAGTGLAAFRNERDRTRRAHIALFTASFVFFMSAFAVSNYFGEITTDYEMNFWGPLGLLVGMLMAGYSVMQKLRYHWHTVVSELLVWGLVTLIGIQFFYIEDTTPFVINSAAFLATIVFGLLMIRYATVEIRQRDVEASLKRQVESVTRLSTGKMKDVLTRAKFLFNEFGSNPQSTDDMRAKSLQGYAMTEEGLASINEVQNAYNLKNRQVTMDLNSVDFRAIVQSVADQKKLAAEKRSLTFTYEIEPGNLMIIGDLLWLRELVSIYIDNAIRYTKIGGITVGAKRDGKNALFWVKDTGVGIPDADRAVLFSEAGRGSHAAEINPDTLGFGLYLAKLVVDAHHGRTWVLSEPGHGATFYVEIPLIA